MPQHAMRPLNLRKGLCCAPRIGVRGLGCATIIVGNVSHRDFIQSDAENFGGGLGLFL